MSRIVMLLSVLFIGALLFRTAWLGDDAFITLRSVDNAVNGYGLRWNVAERVQSFTHPAWLLLILPFYAVTREPYYTVLALQGVLTLVTIGLICRAGAASPLGTAMAVGAFACSRALVDFSTSGLESPLAHLLLVLFVLEWRRVGQSGPSLIRLGLTTSGLLLCRLDLGCLVAPLVLDACWPLRRTRLQSFALGLIPFAAWEAFSLLYYGMLVPNTALAKLPDGVPAVDLIAQGLRYFSATYHYDPATPILLALTATILTVLGGRAGRLVCLGMVAHLAYVVSVGGDFMSGRFLTPSLLMGIVGSLMFAGARGHLAARVAGAAIIVALAAIHPQSAFRAPKDFGAPHTLTEAFLRDGVSDERLFYYPWLGLRRVIAGEISPEQHPWARWGRAMRADGTALATVKNVGLGGYYAGPGTYLIDVYALTDPFLSRLPAGPGWRIGHFERDVPALYVASRERGQNLIEDPELRRLYRDVDELTRGHVWDHARIGPILRHLWRR